MEMKQLFNLKENIQRKRRKKKKKKTILLQIPHPQKNV